MDRCDVASGDIRCQCAAIAGKQRKLPLAQHRENTMRTTIIMLAGFALLAAFLAAAPKMGGRRTAALVFAILWLLVTLANLYIGTTHGYTVMQEAPIFLLLFGVPAAAALWLTRRQA